MFSVRILLLFLFFFSSQISFCQIDYESKIEHYLNHFQFDSAYVIAQKAMKSSKTDSERRADYYIKYAKILKSLSKADSCFYYLDEAEKFFTSKQNQSKLFHILTIKAEVSRSLVKRNIANKYIYEAEKLLSKNKSLEYKYYYYNRRIALLAEYYNNVPDSVVKIKEIAQLILDNKDEIDDKSLIVYTLNELGFLDFNRNPENAKKYFLKAFEIAEKSNSVLAYIDVSINLGRYFQQKELDYSSATYYYHKGLKQAKKINNLWQMQQCYNELKNTAELSEDYKSAMQYGDSLNSTNNLLNEFTNNKKYELLENNYIIQTKEKELITSKKNQLMLLVILLLLLTGLTSLWFYSNKIRKSKKILEKLNKENEFLVSETNHRVNNNLQLISLLISETVRKNRIAKKENIDLIRLQSKIQSIALLHRELYASKDKKTVDLQLYFAKIEESFSEICTNEKIILKLNVDSVLSDSDTAMYMGLLVTELIMNAVKHAFESDQIKNIRIEIVKFQNKFEFTYSDNGQRNKSKEINPILVKQLCQQLGVNPEIIIENGFHLSFIKSIENA